MAVRIVFAVAGVFMVAAMVGAAGAENNMQYPQFIFWVVCAYCMARAVEKVLKG